MLLTKDQILSAADIKSEVVPVPEWGGDVSVKVMSGTDRDAFQAAMTDSDKSISFYHCSLLAATVVGDDGQLLFTAGDIAALRAKSSAAAARVATVSERLNGIGAAAQEAAVKNSEAAPSDSSGSDLPVN